MKASKRHCKSNSIQFKQEGSVVYSVGLIFRLFFFFTAVISFPSEGPYSPLWRYADWVEMFVKSIVGRFKGTRFQQWRISGSSRYVFRRIGSDFQIQRKKSKLFFTDALNACNKCIRVQCDMHRAVTELSDISIEGFISKFLHV